MTQFVGQALLSRWAYRIARITLAVVFLYAGAIKLADPKAFARVISEYGLVPEQALVLIAVGLPILEFLAGLGLIYGVRGSLEVILGLLMMFLLVLGFGILNDLRVDCGCFSAEEVHAQNDLRKAFYRDIAMMAVAIYLFLWRSMKRRTGNQPLLVDGTQTLKGGGTQ